MCRAPPWWRWARQRLALRTRPRSTWWAWSNGVWGVYRSDDAGVTWARFNDDAHQFGGIGVMAADQNIYGRIYISGTGRGMLYSY